MPQPDALAAADQADQMDRSSKEPRGSVRMGSALLAPEGGPCVGGGVGGAGGWLPNIRMGVACTGLMLAEKADREATDNMAWMMDGES